MVNEQFVLMMDLTLRVCSFFIVNFLLIFNFLHLFIPTSAVFQVMRFYVGVKHDIATRFSIKITHQYNGKNGIKNLSLVKGKTIRM